MKKILSILASLSFAISSTIPIISCAVNTQTNFTSQELALLNKLDEIGKNNLTKFDSLQTLENIFNSELTKPFNDLISKPADLETAKSETPKANQILIGDIKTTLLTDDEGKNLEMPQARLSINIYYAKKPNNSEVYQWNEGTIKQVYSLVLTGNQ